MKLNDIKYLALEGGGAMGVAYLGAVKFLEDAGALPLFGKYTESPSSGDNPNGTISHHPSPIEGISGSSAGAITAFMLAIGMTAKEIEKETAVLNDSKGEPYTRFSGFIEKPIPCLYRGVVTHQESDGNPEKMRNIPCFFTDGFKYFNTKIGKAWIVDYLDAFELVKNDKNKDDIIDKISVDAPYYIASGRGKASDQMQFQKMFVKLGGKKRSVVSGTNLHSTAVPGKTISRVAKATLGKHFGLVKLALADPFFTERLRLFLQNDILRRVFPHTNWNNATINRIVTFASSGFLFEELLMLLWGIVKAVSPLKRKKLKSFLPKKLFANFGSFKNYIYSLFYDRGLSTGIYIRHYLAKLIVEYFRPKKFNVCQNDINNNGEVSKCSSPLPNPFEMTFKELYERTHKTLKLTGTNITSNRPLVFSHIDTPDFPVIEAVCISAAFPMAFKSTYVNCKVDFGGQRTDPTIPAPTAEELVEKNKKYQGFYVDGGMLNNTPLHLFDSLVNNPTGTIKSMNGVLAIGLLDGNDPDESKTTRESDSDFDQHKKFFTENPNAPSAKIDRIYAKVAAEDSKPRSFSKEGILASYDIKTHWLQQILFPRTKHLGDYIGNLVSTLLYPMEDGQFFNEKEKSNHYIGLYSYDIDTLNFDPDEYIVRFVQKRAFAKMYTALGYTQKPLAEMLAKAFPIKETESSAK